MGREDNKIYKKNTFAIGELFCGAGGLALGAKNAEVKDSQGVHYGFKLLWANDIDDQACETFIHNITPEDPSKVICGKVEELKFEELPIIEGLLFGFPCNDFSVVGEHKGMSGQYGPLYTYGAKVLELQNPLFFLAENVSGLSSANDGKAFVKILKDLESAGLGYNITPHLYKFEQYGVPQTRHRIIVVGIRKDLGLKFKVPSPTHKNRYVSCSEALKDVENVPYNNEKTKHPNTTIERLKYIPEGGNAWHTGIPEHLKLNVKKCRLSHIYRRLHRGYPAYTITGNGGGGTHVYHWSENRALTNRERARLQAFPDSFEFLGSKESVRAQIGQAVPPLVAKIIMEAVLKTLLEMKYEHESEQWLNESFNSAVEEAVAEECEKGVV